MTREEALHALLETAHTAIANNPEVNLAIAQLESVGLHLLQIRMMAEVKTDGAAETRNSDEEFLSFLRIVPDLKVTE